MPSGRESTRSPRTLARTSSATAGAQLSSAAAQGGIDIQELLDKLAADQEAKFHEVATAAATAAAKAIAGECKKDIYKILAPIEQANSVRFSALEVEQADIKRRIDRIEAGQTASSSQLDAINETLIRARQETPLSESIDMEDFSRPANPCIIRLRAAADITINQFKAVFSETMSNLRLVDGTDFRYEASPLGRVATIAFAGSADLAKLRAQKFYTTLKDQRGVWIQHQTTTSTGETIRVFADIDKNRRTLKAEMLLRRLTKFLAGENLGGKFTSRKTDLQVCRDWVPLVRLGNITHDDYVLQWNLPLAQQLGIDRDNVATRFEAIAKPGGDVSWG